MLLPRSSGILLHPTSLPGGRLGGEAYRFVDWLVEAGQSWWQVLPLGPPDERGSPYKASSAFAGSTGLLAEPEAPVEAAELEDFVRRHPFWIGEWAAFAGGEAVAGQVRFEREWTALRRYAARRGVRLLGDLPIYVAPDGADHRGRPELFRRGLVAGVPPDAFSASGQLWGNPVYDWRALAATGYRWWTERFRRTFELFDLARVDHFRAFVAYWAVPAGHRSARRGSWRRGPGRAVFEAARSELGDLRLVAEDLGVITPAVERLRAALALPGMRVLQFADDGEPRNPHNPENHPEHCVVYTGTHDNDTAVGWARRAGDERPEPHWRLIGAALASRARLAIVPAQDVLGLGSEARMNTPGKEAGNWSWRLERGALSSSLAARLAEATRRSGRRAPRPPRSERRSRP